MKYIPGLLFVLFIALIAFACQDKQGQKDELASAGSGLNIAFNQFPPEDLDSTATDTQLVNFAWEELIALNWKSSYSSNGKRDYPDTTWNWTKGDADTVVWETFAHRTELRPASDTMQAFDNPPHYSFGSKLYPATVNGKPASFMLFNNLDENNEIGSCDVYAHVNQFQKQYMVLYQAKVNRDEYQYIFDNYNTKAKLDAATTKTKNNIKNHNAYYDSSTNTCNCPTDSGVVCLPCGGAEIPGMNGKTYQGAMEVKTAWRVLNPSVDDTTKFFTRKAIYYYAGKDGKIYYSNKTFGLIGIHIIHKTKNYPAFIFATWEHVDVQKDSMGYVLLDNGQETGPLIAPYTRLHPIPSLVDSSTSVVHNQIKGMNSNSVWLNYRLVGVQAKPTSDSTSFSFFLANFVIESDTTLADFHGSSIGSPHDMGENILYKGQPLGCPF